jgi:hypothetical protein
MSAMKQDLPAAQSATRGVEEEVMGPEKGVPSSRESVVIFEKRGSSIEKSVLSFEKC